MSVPRTFRNPSGARPVPFQGRFSILPGTFASAVLWHDHGKRRRRLTTCQSCHSSVWYSLSLLLCVDVVCARSNPEESHTKKNLFQKCKMSYCSAHQTFRTHHAALEASRMMLLSAMLDAQRAAPRSILLARRLRS